MYAGSKPEVSGVCVLECVMCFTDVGFVFFPKGFEQRGGGAERFRGRCLWLAARVMY